MQTVGAAGIPACGTASSYNLLSFLLQCRGQECPQLLQLAFTPNFFFVKALPTYNATISSELS